MATYSDILKANQDIKSTELKNDKTGKKVGDYVEVNQRIKAFRMVHPDGAITTEILSLDNGIVTMKATVLNAEGTVLATGHAQEKESSTFINKTSFIENCETSAVGRALGMCGFGIDSSIASKEEVENAVVNQNKPQGKQQNKPMQVNPGELIKKYQKEINELGCDEEALITYLQSRGECTEEGMKKALERKAQK